MLAQAATPAVTIQQQARRDDISVRRRPEIDCMMANPVLIDCAGFDSALCKGRCGNERGCCSNF